MLKILFPFHGAVLHHRHGRQDSQGLAIEVYGTAPICTEVKVNGQIARRKGELFFAEIRLQSLSTEITASCSGVTGFSEQTVRVIWNRNSRRRYRVSIDDNSFFLRDLWQKRPADIFDNHYLAILKRLQHEFASKYTLNLFFSTPEKDFDLTMMPETWKKQFAENSDWLKMTWHSDNEFPDRPYQYATPEKVAADLDKIQAEVFRFAGESSFCPPTIVHWGEIQPSVLPTLYQRGVRALSGYFNRGEQRYEVSNGLDEVRCHYLNSHDALMDFESGIVFSHTDIVVNSTPLEQIVPTLSQYLNDPDHSEFMDILTHEQYFWPFYFNYLPDHEQRMAAAFRFLKDNDYEPVWMHEGLLGSETK